jgi:hypothetical protein
MRKLVAALLLLVSVAGVAQTQAVAQEHRVAPGTTGMYDDYPEWAQRAFEPKK